MKLKTQLYIDFLEYALESVQPKHSTSCKEFYVKSIGLGVSPGRYEWNCSTECPTNGIPSSVIGDTVSVTDFDDDED